MAWQLRAGNLAAAAAAAAGCWLQSPPNQSSDPKHGAVHGCPWLSMAVHGCPTNRRAGCGRTALAAKQPHMDLRIAALAKKQALARLARRLGEGWQNIGRDRTESSEHIPTTNALRYAGSDCFCLHFLILKIAAPQGNENDAARHMCRQDYAPLHGGDQRGQDAQVRMGCHAQEEGQRDAGSGTK